MKEQSELKHLLEWQEQRWGQDHPKIISTLEAIADLLQMQEKYVEAEPLYWQILEKKHRLYGDNDLRVADTIYDLACLQELQQNWSECERLYKWTCDIRCRLLPPGDAKLDESLSKAKEMAAKQGKTPEQEAAEAAYNMTPQTDKKNLDWQPYLDRARELLAARDYDQSENILNCLAAMASAYEPETPVEAEVCYLLARTQFFKKELHESLQSFEKALALSEKVCGASSKETAACLEDMADLQCKLGDRAQSEFLFNWAIQIRSGLKDDEQNLMRLQVKLNSIEALCKIEDLEAEEAENRKQEIARAKKQKEAGKPEQSVDGSRSPDQVQSYLWHQYFVTGKKALEKQDFVGAEMMLARALDKANEFGVQDQRLWQTICQMAAIHQSQGKLVKAESLYKSAQQLCEKSLGPNHPDNANYWELLGNLYESTGDSIHAAICYDRLVNIKVKAGCPLVDYAPFLKKLERMHVKPPESFFE